MARSPQFVVYYEGDDDHAILAGLKGAGLLPARFSIANRKDRKRRLGKEGMLRDVAALVSPLSGAGKSAVALRDRDDEDEDALGRWFESTLRDALKELDSRGTAVNITRRSAEDRLIDLELSHESDAGRLVGVMVGLSEDEDILTLGMKRFSVDDYVLRLARIQAVYDAISETAEVPFDKAMAKLDEVLKLFHDNQIPIESSKRLLHILRAIANFRASNAEFIGRVMAVAPIALEKDRFEELLAPLAADLQVAFESLTG